MLKYFLDDILTVLFVLNVLDDVVLRFIAEKSPILLYGEKGVGKTLFLLQIAYSFWLKGYRTYILGSNNTMSTINNRLPRLRNIEIINNVKIYDIFSLNERIKAFKETIVELKKIKEIHRTPICILIDDILPADYQIDYKIRLEETIKINRILFWLKLLQKILNICIIITTNENIKKKLPYKASIFRHYGYSLLRIEKETRIRTIQEITIKNKNNNQIKTENLWQATITPNGFILKPT